ncbi:capsular polysaccharide synthesis protein [Streptococcus pneumoniae]|uniref:capsular polysaccharide synthesis protein n=1 Tax=Streptococcus pneumoniae TaxID=1313 RepID=UPI0035AC13FC
MVLTEENISDYIDIPDYITDKYKKGSISRAHYSDYPSGRTLMSLWRIMGRCNSVEYRRRFLKS